MASDKDEVASDSFCERYKQRDFLYSRNDQYKIVNLHFSEKQQVQKYSMIDLFKFEYRKVKLDDNFKIHSDERPREIYIKSDVGNIIEEHHLKKASSAIYVNWSI